MRRSWAARCDDLAATITKLRAQLTTAGEMLSSEPIASASGLLTTGVVDDRSSRTSRAAVPLIAEALNVQQTGWEEKVQTLETALLEAHRASSYAAGHAQAAAAQVATAGAAARAAAAEAADWRIDAERVRRDSAATLEHAQQHPRHQPRSSLNGSKDGRGGGCTLSLASEAVDLAQDAAETRVALADAQARAHTHDMETSRVVDFLEQRLHRLSISLEALGPEASLSIEAESDSRRAIASAESRLQLEHQRFAQRLEHLQSENEELRRATRAKTDKIKALKLQLGEQPRMAP